MVEQAVARGSDALKQGKLDEAQSAFLTALELDGDNPRILALLGLAHFRSNHFERARAIYEELVERLPTDASHRLNLGLVYLKLGDAGKAIHSLEASRALDPSQGRAVSYLGLAYARAGRYPEAYRSFLLAGQSELANEIEGNLTAAERDGIKAQLGLTAAKPAAAPAPAASAPATAPTRPTPPPAPAARAPMPPPQVFPVSAESIEAEQDVELDTAPMFAGEKNASAAPSDDPSAPRMSDSLQFVLPARTATVQPVDGRSMISHAVETAAPAVARTSSARVGIGNQPPIPLSQLATEELVRPDDGEETFELTPSGALVIRVAERVMTRLDGVHVTGGDLAFERATRRSRGHQTDERFDHGGSQLHAVTGHGYAIALPDQRVFTAVALDDDIFYLREDLVFAFEATLRWENGNVPGLRGRLPVVQFRGDGAVAIRSERPLVRVKLPPQGILFVDATRLAGWIGRVIPRAVVPPSGGPMGDVCVECTGEGVVLVDPSAPPFGGDGMRAEPPASAKLPAAKLPPATKATPPPPPSPDDAPPGRDEF